MNSGTMIERGTVITTNRTVFRQAAINCPSFNNEGLFLAAKNSASSTDERPCSSVDYEFWHAMSGENGTVLEALVKKFNETHTNIEVVSVFQGHYRELFEKLNGAAQAGTLPALSMIYCNRLTAYVMNDLVEDLNPRIADAKYGFDPVVWLV